ncbi:hypothetical protein QPK87_10800 [Kamptonema cortianum]|nr:hypothetical protein [Geitlerinema splendidum]MDK3157062.1 hypothetical protein [Kamptonema cortianum]
MKAILLASLVYAAGTLGVGDDMLALRWEPKGGETYLFEHTIASGEGENAFEATAVIELKVKLVGRDGSYQTEATSKGVLIRLGGGEMKDDRSHVTLISHDASGKVIKILKSNDELAAMRSASLTRFVSPNHPVSVGTSWQVLYPASKEFNGARVNYKFEELRGANNQEAVVSFTIAEDNRERPFKGSGTWVIDRNSGKFISMSAKVDNWLPDMAQATITVKRLPVSG